MIIDLRAVTKNDAEIIFQAWGGNPENFQYLSAKPQKNIADADAYIKQLLLNKNLAFHIIEPESGKVVGHMKALIDGHKALIGYVVDQQYWGQGVATQALKKIIIVLQGMLEIARIWATCAIDNEGSIKVLERCGFKREGLLKNWIVYPAQGLHPQDNYSFCFNA